MPNNVQSFKYVDLFAGCGGLSLGLESAGGQLLVAVERSSMAGETFFKNLIGVGLSDLNWEKFKGLAPDEQAKSGLIVNDITEKTTFQAVQKKIAALEVDLVAGGPPCQGFSLAGRRQADDKRNSLAWDFLEYVALANPKFVLIENVPGMNARFKSQEDSVDSAFNQVARALEDTGRGYLVQKLHLNSVHYGAAQTRERLFLIGCRKDVANKLGIEPSLSVWKSDFLHDQQNVPELAPPPTTSAQNAVTARQALADLLEQKQNSSYVDLLKNNDLWGLKKHSGLHNFNFRKHSDVTKLKFEVYLAIKRLGLSPNLMKSSSNPIYESNRNRLRAEIWEIDAFPIYASDGSIIAETPDQFDDLVEKFRTRKHSQRVLDLERTPPTVITSPDDYLHPLEPRVLTVRELARFQGFSDHFIFYSKETTGGLKRRTEVPQYSQVGNAVSPWVSRAFGLLFSSLLSRI